MGLYIEFDETKFVKASVPQQGITELKKKFDNLKGDYSSGDNAVAKVSVDPNPEANPHKNFIFHILTRRHEKKGFRTLQGTTGNYPSAKEVAKTVMDLLENPVEGVGEVAQKKA